MNKISPGHFYYKNSKKWQTCKPGSVILRRLTENLYHLSCYNITVVILAAYPSRLLRASKKQSGQLCCTATAANNRDIFGFATRETYGRQCHHCRRCAFTAPFHPFPKPTRRFAMVIFCYVAILFQRSSR